MFSAKPWEVTARGLFLIEKMVDEVRVIKGDGTHTIELIMYREGDNNGNQGA